MGQRRHKGAKEKRSDKNERLMLWLSLAAAVGKIVQVVISFFHGGK
jgi:hypothetical protein